MALDWYWWVVIGVGAVIVLYVLYTLLFGGSDEEVAEEQMEKKEHIMVDLDDAKVLSALEKDGLKVGMAMPTHLMVSEDGEKGFSWILNEDSDCSKILDIEVLDGPPKMDEAKEGDEKKDEDKDEKKDEEKKLRQDDEKKDDDKEDDAEKKDETPKTYMALTGKKEGTCTFQMAYAESWDYDWEDKETWPEATKVIQFDITVAKEDAKDEKKSEDKDAEKDGEADKDAEKKDE
uniref:Uncharacterized protein n=3 Tax=Choreotrichia TaxID=141411 RepID=A0A7S3I6V3_9SPIT|mmetsp:Transcript_436/g.619  ORF Transcript_436/g.619 Transcript_436/m.619 type:complete len:233 (+) Transcript_436:33-731(+)